MVMTISKEDWHTCKICGCKIKQLSKDLGGSGKYYTEVFVQHLKNSHQMTPEEYFASITDRPRCSCGICGQLVDLTWKGKANFSWRNYKCGRNKGVQEWSKEAKVARRGKNNPMHGKKPWNFGKTKNDYPSLMTVSDKMTGRNITDETRRRQSESAKKRKTHGHTGCKHSEASKDKMRQATLKAIKEGKLKQTRTRPHLMLVEILTDLGVAFQEEYVIKYWSFDFYLTDLHVLIEVDGDYYHSNPKFYPEPKTKTQKINYYRDQKKNEFCQANHHALIRIWEDDIVNNTEKIKCELKKLLTFG
jgi:very-short-patch-repair endonuclease